jgi:hypothetical protein
VQAGKTVKRVTFTLFGHIQSGLPFTPIVGGDVNGDGLANDRAFIFDPAAGSALGAGLRALTASSSARTRDCLSRQIGHPAGRNSCEGPWTATLNGQIGTQFEIPHSLGRWVAVSLGVANPLGGLDQLLHGSSRLKGWGLPAFPDPVLYNVRGFDSATNRFRYEVNPRFGNTQPANSVIRDPFRLTLDVSMNVGPAVQMQQLERWIGAGRGKRSGPRLTAEELKKKYSRNVPNPYSDILEESDSLLLTANQERAIDSVQKDYLHGVDSLWTPLTEYLAALGDTFDPKDAVNRQEAVTDAAWEFSRLHVQRSLGTILSPVQLKLLPWEAGLLYTAKKPLRVRMFSG